MIIEISHFELSLKREHYQTTIQFIGKDQRGPSEEAQKSKHLVIWTHYLSSKLYCHSINSMCMYLQVPNYFIITVNWRAGSELFVHDAQSLANNIAMDLTYGDSMIDWRGDG